MGQHNIIELNGKQYDAITGALLGPAKQPVTVPVPAGRSRAVDGFFRASKVIHGGVQPGHQAAATGHAHQAKPAAAAPAAPKGRRMDVSRPPNGKHLAHHQPQKGKTLMRRAVAKPQTTLKPKIKTAAPSEIAPPSVKTIAKPLAKKVSVSNVDPARIARAGATSRSSHIRRFQPARAHAKPAVHAAAVPSPLSRPAAFTPSHVARSAARPAAANAAKPSSPTPQTDIFEAAIARATSHEQLPPRAERRRSGRAVGMFAGVAAFLIMGGFLTYLNMPGIEMRFASVQVGFNAELPKYTPTGYALTGGVKQEAGKVSVSFRSGDRSYTVTQQASDWNSQTLFDNFVAVNASNHQTVQSQGRTIYIWGGNNAAWVDGGVRYDITGNAPLKADDIVKLASSM